VAVVLVVFFHIYIHHNRLYAISTDRNHHQKIQKLYFILYPQPSPLSNILTKDLLYTLSLSVSLLKVRHQKKQNTAEDAEKFCSSIS